MTLMWSAALSMLVFDSFFDSSPDATGAVAGAPILVLLGYLIFYGGFEQAAHDHYA